MITSPTVEQAAIIASQSNVQLIDAVAGSGKTTTLAMLAKEWASKNMSAGYAACLSFTSSAKKRFQEKLSQEKVPASVSPNTLLEFARYALNCLVRSGQIDQPYFLQSAIEIRANLVGAANVVWEKYEQSDESEFDFGFEHNTKRIDQLLQVLKRFKSRLKAQKFDDDDFYSSGIYLLADEFDVPVEVVEICAAHERMRQRMPGEFQWQTEDDVVPDLVSLLQRNPNAVNFIPKASLLLIDEWHDVNAAEFELIRIIRRGARLVVVADRDQVIDEERGAELRFSTTYFLATYPHARQYPLSKSHRFGASLGRKLDGIASRKVYSVDGSHTVIRKLRYDPTNPTACSDVVRDQVIRIYNEGFDTKLSEISIIVREADQSIEIENSLIEADIPYSCFGIASYLFRSEILMLRALLHLASGSYEQLRNDTHTVNEMVQALAMFVSMSRDRRHWDVEYYSVGQKTVDPLEQAVKMIAKEPAVLESFFTGVLCRVHDYDRDSVRRWKDRFNHAIAKLKEHSHSSDAATLMRKANAILDLPAAVNRALLQQSQADSALRSIQSFIGFADNFSTKSVADFLDELLKRQSKMSLYGQVQRQRRQVAIATVKSAKGHEWKHVIIPYLQKREFPRSGNYLEEARYFYVAATRAKESLSLAEPKEEFDDYRSPFVL